MCNKAALLNEFNAFDLKNEYIGENNNVKVIAQWAYG